MRMSGRVAMVTGGTRGLGRAIADEYAREGATVVCASRSGGQADPHPSDKGAGSLVYDTVDVGDAGSVADLVERTVKDFGRLDVVVANAGISIDGRVDALAVADWDQQVSTNLSGTFYVLRAVVPQMRNQGGGRIVTVSSVLARHPVVGASAYIASKAAIEALTRAAAVELARDAIAVNCLAPGFVGTGMGERVADNPRVWAAYQKRIALGRLADPGEIAEMAVVLATAGPYLTGHVLEVNGGFW